MRSTSERRDRVPSVRATALLVLALIWMSPTQQLWAQDDPLKLDLQQFVVVRAEDEPDGERLLPLGEDNGAPGTVIEYRLTATNVSESPLSDIILGLHIPQGTRYLDGYARHDRSIGLLQFSIDSGETYRTPPILYYVEDDEGNRVQQTATADMYTTLRWVLLRALEPGEEVRFAFRVEVE